jgi:hypothetical protein
MAPRGAGAVPTIWSYSLVASVEPSSIATTVAQRSLAPRTTEVMLLDSLNAGIRAQVEDGLTMHENHILPHSF